MFTSKELKKDTWAIYGHGSTAYLVAGDREGAMIDTGDQPENLRDYAQSLCGKPVRMVLNTHGHFDHTGGNGYFQTAFMGRLAAEIAREPNGGQELEQFPLDYSIVIVDDGFKIDLGNRELEAIRMDGHSPDCISWLDKAGRILFTGDNMGPFVPMQYKCVDPQPSMLLYTMSVCKLMARREEYDWTCAGHSKELIDADVVNHTLMAALRALDGEVDEPPAHKGPKPGNKPKGDPGPFAKHDPADQGFITYKGASIIFNRRYLKDTTRYDVIHGT